MPGDAVSIAPDNYRTVFENDRLRLLEYNGGPGAKTEMHYHPDIMAYALTDGKFRFALENGQTIEAELKSGEAMFMDGHSHATENIGDTNARILLVELK